MTQEITAQRSGRQKRLAPWWKRLAPYSLCGIWVLLAAGPGAGGTGETGETGTLTAGERERVVEAVCEKVEAIYPFAEVGDTVRSGILANLRSGAYDDISSARELASRVTVDMEELGDDKHLDLLYDPVMAAELRAREEQGENSTAGPGPSLVESGRWGNFGFKEVRSLDGRVGYLDLRVFFPPKHAGATAAAAMGFLAGSNAVILDLRHNGGGWDDMVTLLAGYFTDLEEPEVVAISQSTLDQSYFASTVPAYVPGEKLTGIPIYILLSGSTASAAEAFASILKELSDEVVLVGETSAGAENPVEFIPLDEVFVLKIPCYRKIFFGTRASWEGEGIEPDVAVPAVEALEVAHLHALRTLEGRLEGSSAQEKLQWGIDGLQARLEPASLRRSLLETYAGSYRGSVIRLGEEGLMLQFGEGAEYRLLPVSDGYFVVAGRDDLRIRLLKENDQVNAFERIYDDGYRALHARE